MAAAWTRSRWIRSARTEMDAMQRSHGARALRGLGLLFGLLMLGGCEAGQPGTSSSPTVAAAAATVQPEESRMWMTLGERRFAITLADTEAARAFAAMLPLTIDMADLNSNEKHADLPQIAADERNPARNDPQRRPHAVRVENLGRLLSDVRLVLLVHAPRPRGRSLWPCPGARPSMGCGSRSPRTR